MSASGNHVTNLNHTLKGIKLDVTIDFIRSDYKELIIVSNKVVLSSNISIVSNYVKNTNNMDSNNVQNVHFPQSKSYFKILDILYLIENTNMPINSSVIEIAIKATYIFNNIKITSKPRVCKVSPKSNMVIVWIDIWDSQNSSSAKRIIN